MLAPGSAASGRVDVPRKLIEDSYAGGFFHQIPGTSVEHIVTIRHPVGACFSTCEIAGGLPQDGRHAVRGNIEQRG